MFTISLRVSETASFSSPKVSLTRAGALLGG